MMRPFRRGVTVMAALTLFFFFLGSITLAGDEEKNFKYVASKQGKRYHYPTCPAAKRIKPENLVGYPSIQAALRAGYTPCKICKPPPQE